MRTPIGGAVIAAIALAIGVHLSYRLGLTEEPEAVDYTVGAAAGFVGGFIGTRISNRRRR